MKYKLVKKEKMYTVAVRKRLNNEDHFWMHDDYQFIECNIPMSDRYWYADPFLFEKDGITYIFYEAFDLVTKLGKIGYSILKEDGTCSSPNIIIDEKFHMSFPNIFEENGSIYIMPETCGDYRVKLYRAISFPDKWVVEHAVLDDVFACDTVMIDEGSNRYLLANEMYHNCPVNSYPSCWVKNMLYPMKGLTVNGVGIKVAEGDYGIRNAGKVVKINDHLYRIGQDCRFREYGRGMCLFRIDNFSPYQETQVWSVDYNNMSKHVIQAHDRKYIGTHTYNFSEHYEIIDLSSLNKVCHKTRARRIWYNLTHIKL